MRNIIKFLDLQNPEGFDVETKSSKFSNFEKPELTAFVKEYFLQSCFSIFIPKELQNDYINESSKSELITLCSEIEYNRSLFFKRLT